MFRANQLPNTDTASDFIGQVIDADINRGTIRILITGNGRCATLSRPIVIDDDNQLFYAIVVNRYQHTTDAILNLARSRTDMSEAVRYEHAGHGYHSNFDDIAEVMCMCIVARDQERIKREGFVTIPSVLAPCRKPTKDELMQVYANNFLREYWIGTTTYDRDIFIPIQMDKMIQRPLAVAGATGFGKTVLVRNLCKAIIHDPQHILQTSMIIFDIMNEYAKNSHIHNVGNLGLLDYPVIQDRIEVITLDRPHAERIAHIDGQYLHDLVIWKDNISLADVIAGMQGKESRSDLMLANLRGLSDIARQLRGEYDEQVSRGNRPAGSRPCLFSVLERYINDRAFGLAHTSGSNKEASYDALRWRIWDFVNGHLAQFIRDRPSETARDSIELIKAGVSRTLDAPIDGEVKTAKSFILYFGQYTGDQLVYEFIANLMMTKIYALYNSIDNRPLDDGTDNRTLFNAVIVLEEAHNFIPKDESGSVAERMAREARKYGLTLFMVDQCPSSLNERIMAQVANRFICRLNNSDDMKVALAGMDGAIWKPIVGTLDQGYCVAFGEMVQYIPTLMWSYFNTGSQADELRIRGIAASPITRQGLSTSQDRVNITPSQTPRRNVPKRSRPACAVVLDDQDEFFDDPIEN